MNNLNSLVEGLTTTDTRIWEAVCTSARQSEARQEFLNIQDNVLRRDLFHCCYNIAPELKDTAPSGREHEHAAIKRLYESRAIPEIRERTVLQPLYAFLAAHDLGNTVQNLALDIKANQARGCDYGGIGVQVVQKLEKLEQTLDDAQEASVALGFNFGRGTQEGTIPAASNLDAAMRYMSALRNKRMLDLIELIGRLRSIYRQERARRPNFAPEDITGVELGNSLAKLLPQALSLAGNAQTRPLFRKGFLEKSLPQYELKRQLTEAKGPMIVLLDKSGSMEGNRDAWATAVALVLRELAEEEKRDFWVLPFHGHVLGTYFFPKGKADPELFLKVYALPANGSSTNGKAALDKALELIRANAQAKKADIAALTDGQWGVAAYAAEVKRDLASVNARLWMLLVEFPDLEEARAITAEENVQLISSLTNRGEERAVIKTLAAI